VKLRIKKLSSQAMGQARGPCGLNNCTWILRANTKSCPLLVVSVQPSASEETGLGAGAIFDFRFWILDCPLPCADRLLPTANCLLFFPSP
jgi:hypothetical protein